MAEMKGEEEIEKKGKKKLLLCVVICILCIQAVLPGMAAKSVIGVESLAAEINREIESDNKIADEEGKAVLNNKSFRVKGIITGDTSPVLLFVIFIIISGLVLYAVYIIRSKITENNSNSGE